VEGCGALVFGYGAMEDAGRFCHGNQNCFHSWNLAKQIVFRCPSFPQLSQKRSSKRMLHLLTLWAKLPHYLQEGRMGVVECTALALKK
jgi:hypothetical protein